MVTFVTLENDSSQITRKAIKILEGPFLTTAFILLYWWASNSAIAAKYTAIAMLWL
jgi:hypothetical protein